MTTYTKEDIKKLVKPDRIHRKAFTDPEIFELELKQIFYRTWIFVGHESQVPNPGDYYCTRIGRQPIIMARHSDGKVYVMYNRCAHRGALVLNDDYGNKPRFVCMAHGWNYNPDGSFLGCPFQKVEEDEGFDFSEFRLEPVAEVGIHHGFVFAKLTPGGTDFQSWLGRFSGMMDEIVELSPEGRLEMSRTCHKYWFRGNWKHQVDQFGDGYHVYWTHLSTTRADGRQFKRRPGDEGGGAKFVDDTGKPDILKRQYWAFANGHSAAVSLFGDERQAGGAWEKYRGLLMEKYGEKRAEEVLQINQKYHSLDFFPTCDWLIVQSALRTYLPVSANLTEVRVFPIRVVGIPDEIYQEQIRMLNFSHSASSLIQTDDVESFRRFQDGLQAECDDWVLCTRGITRDRQVDNDGTWTGDKTTELGLRNCHNAWLNLMVG